MKNLSKSAMIGYPAGIITGITYGLNPLFAMPLMSQGAAIESILFFRYFFAVVLLGAFLFLSKERFKISGKQAGILLVLGLLYDAQCLRFRSLPLYCIWAGYHTDFPLSRTGGYHHGLFGGGTFVAGMAGYYCDIWRCSDHDTR